MIFMAVVYFIIFSGNQETFTLLPAMHTHTHTNILENYQLLCTAHSDSLHKLIQDGANESVQK